MDREDCVMEHSKCEVLVPDGKDFCIEKDDCEKQVDICLKKRKNVSIFGYVCDCKDRPVKDAMVRLYQYEDYDMLREICHTYTDCDGYYQFNLRGNYEGKYHVFVSESNCCEKESGNATCRKHICEEMYSCSCAQCQRNEYPKNSSRKTHTNKVDYYY